MSELKFDENNFRIHTDENKRIIRKSLEECGAGRSVLVDKDDCLIAGNGVYEQAKELGIPIKTIETDGSELIVVKRNDLDYTDHRRKKLAFADNHASDTSLFDKDLVIENFSSEELEEWAFSLDDIDLTDELPQIDIKPVKLEDIFLFPPFSVLDARKGRWAERKKQWLDMGIKSELGREDDITYSRSSQSAGIYDIRNRMRAKTGIDPSWDEIEAYCKTNGIKMMAGTSVFDPVLCELCYKWFNLDGGIVLDPFAGGSVRGVVAAHMNMPYFGFELRKEQVEANRRNYEEIFEALKIGHAEAKWICEDSNNVDKYNIDADFLFSCPPYADLEVYSNDPRDLSTMEYDKFLEVYRSIIAKSCAKLKNNRFAAFVVGEVRKKDGAYYNFVSDTIKAFTDAGMHYYNEMILVTQIASLAMRAKNQFNNSRKIGKTHQNILVFYKGDLNEIRSIYPDFEFQEEEEDI